MKTKQHKFRSFLSLVLTLSLCLSAAAPALAQEPEGEPSAQAIEETSAYWVFYPDSNQLIGPGNGNVAIDIDPWLWEIEDKNNNDTYKSHVAYTFSPVEGESNTYYWECLTNKSLVVQAKAATAGQGITLKAKDPSEPLQKWVIAEESDGTYTIKNGELYVGGGTYHCAVTLVSDKVTWTLQKIEPEISLSLNRNTVVLNDGDQTVTATVSGHDGSFNSISSNDVTLTSSDTNVATVDGATITAVGAGETLITATLNGTTTTATATLTVSSGATDADLEEGSLYRVYLNLTDPPHGRNLLGPGSDRVTENNGVYAWNQDNTSYATRMYTFEKTSDDTYLWLCRNDPNLAVAAASNGLVLAVKDSTSDSQKWTIQKLAEKSYLIKRGEKFLTGGDQSGPTLSDTQGITFDIEKVSMTPTLTLTLDKSRVALNDDETVTATLSGTDGNHKELTAQALATATITSDNTGVATVSGTTITPVAAGEANITATLSIEGSEYAATATLTVEEEITVPTLDGVYYLSTNNGTQDFQPGGDSINTSNQVIWFYSNVSVLPSRMWTFSDAGDGYMYLHPLTYPDYYVYSSNGADLRFSGSSQGNTKWEVIPAGGDNRYKLRNVALNSYIKDVSNAIVPLTANADEAAVFTFTAYVTPDGWESQYAIYGGDGIGGIFEPSGANVSDGTPLYVWGNSLDEKRVYLFPDAGDGYVYWCSAYKPNIAIASTGGADVKQKTFAVNSDAQKWKLTPVEGKEGVYTIQNKATGTYIAAADDAGNKQIVLSADTTQKSVQWKITLLKPTLIMTASTDTLGVGGTAKAEINARDAFGTAIVPTVTVTSSDPAVLTVADGAAETPAYGESVTFTGQKVPQIMISGVGEGTATITATMEHGGTEYTDQVTIDVVAEPPLFTGEEWFKGITTPEINREPSHADFFPYPDAATAAAAEKSVLDSVDETSSSYYQLLSQKNWDFAMVTNPAAAETADAAGWLAETLPSGQASKFKPEAVPAEWQAYKNADGTFKYDEPVYTNSVYPWGSATTANSINYADPQAPVNYNPVGYYRTTFQTPADWDGRNIFLSFQGVKSAYYVYVNGQEVGYSTDSFTAHDFNITKHLKPAGQSNTLAVKVFRFSIGSYLENQDMIQGSGIIRDVFLYSKDAKAEIRDFFVQTQFADRTSVDSDVTMKVDVDVRNLTEAELTDGYTVDVTLKTLDGQVVGSKATLTYATLKALDGATSAVDATKKAHDGEKKVNLGDRQTATIEVTNPKKWFPDTPNLYMLTIELKDSTGKVVEATAQRVGFREIYKVNINADGQEQMQITGQKLIFRGVNRHDTDPVNGHAVSKQNMIDDLKLMKQLNVNAIRTSHYPNNRLVYGLADELGIYVYAEANVESHLGGYDNAGANSAIPGSDARWVWPVMDRNMNMVELLKNHASIIGWSYSNESTYTTITWDNNYCFWATAMAVLERDPSRLRMYEREDHNYYHPYVKTNNNDDPWSKEHRAKNLVDVHATQYPSASGVKSWAQNTDNKMPYFEQEYEHAMGQSFGSFNEFWKLNRTMPNVQGGFIWDWMDQTRVTTRIVNGKAVTFWAYGGDWIDANSSNADAFCANGVIWADRTPSSRAIQMRYDHQQVNFYPVDDSGNPKTDYKVTDGTLKLKVVNEYENTDLSAFTITWKLMADNEELGGGNLRPNAAGMTGVAAAADFSVDFASDIVTIVLPEVEPEAGVNYLLNLSVENKNRPDWDTSVVEYDNVVAYDQFDLTPTGEDAVVRTPLNLTEMTAFTAAEGVESGNTLRISGTTAEGKAYSFQMDKATGTISNYVLDGKKVLEKGPVPSFWRAMTYNDTPTNYDSNMLRNADDAMELNAPAVITVVEDGKHIKVELNVKLKANATQLMTYDIYSNGEIVVSSSFTPKSDFAPGGSGEWSLPKVGLRMTVAPGFENLEYLGRGPDETYCDRKTASLVDLYSSTVTEQFIKQYIKPQENGNRTDVRWTSLTNDQGLGLMVVAKDTVETSALHVKAENINLSTNSRPYNSANYRHSTDVPMDAQTYWCIDAMQRGVSNTGFFNHIPLPGFYPTTTGTPTYSETFRIVPVVSATDKMAVARLGFSAEKEVAINTDREMIAEVGKAVELPATLPVGGEETAVVWSGTAPGADAFPGIYTVTGTLTEYQDTEVTMTIYLQPKNAEYFVNAGSSDTTYFDKLTNLKNSVQEQTYVEGAWGYTGASNADSTYSGYEQPIDSIRYGQRQATLTYQFDDLDAGVYTAHIGLYDPWSQYAGSRVVTITAQTISGSSAPVEADAKVESYNYGSIKVDKALADIVVPEGGKLQIVLTDVNKIDNNTNVAVSYIYLVRTDAAYVTFNSNGGTAVARQVFTKGANGTATKPSDPIRTGYDFGGWYTDTACTEEYDFATVVNEDVTLYAKWTRVVKSGLTAAITAAKAAKNAVQTVPEGTTEDQVGKDTGFVTEAVMAALDAAIETAQAVADKAEATQAEVDDAVTALNTAVDTFNDAIQIGTAVRTVTFDSQGGSSVEAQEVAKDSKAARPTDPTRSGYSFGGWYTDVECTAEYDFNAAVVEDITLYAKWTAVSSSSSSSKPATTTTTSKNEDGSTTKTVTNKVTGAVTETTTWPDGSKEVVETAADGTVSSSYTGADGSKLQSVTKPDGSSTVTSTDPDGVKVKADTTADGQVSAQVTLPKKVEEASVTIPAKDVTAGTVAVIIHADGTEEIVKTSIPTQDGVALTLTENATLKLIDNAKDFDDVTASHWAADAIDFTSSRELLTGTADKTFSPGDSTTRAMLFTTLARLNGVDTTGGTLWYSKGMDWAVSSGISDGTNPDALITREQLATMLYRYAGQPEAKAIAEGTFQDGNTISDWAVEAMNWAVEAGILKGKDGNLLDPAANATRAEVATMLQRFVTALAAK